MREAEAYVKQVNEIAQKADKDEDEAEDEAPKLPEIDYSAELAKRITDSLGYRVSLKTSRKKKTLVIEYADEDDLEALIEKICGGKLSE